VGSIKVILKDDLEKEFRDEVYKQMGMKKGNITEAIEEAVKDWIEKQRQKRSGIAKKAWEKRKEQIKKENKMEVKT
jgi:epoxyqueuosine reductase QueG